MTFSYTLPTKHSGSIFVQVPINKKYECWRMYVAAAIKAILTGSSLPRSKEESRRILLSDKEVRLFVYTADKTQKESRESFSCY